MYLNNSESKQSRQAKQLPKFIKALSKESKNITVGKDEIEKRRGTIYRTSGNILVIKDTSRTIPHCYAESVRGVISGFSPSAGTRMRSYLRSCLADYKVMLTLTYPFSYPCNGKQTKEHLRRFLQELKRAANRQDERIARVHSSFWFLEFQQRGAPHYHIFTTWAPSKEWVARRWYEIVGSEDERHLFAGTRTEFLRTGRAGTISYASKYAAKLEQKVCPENFENVGRWWGIHGYRAIVAADTFVSAKQRADESVSNSIRSLFKWIDSLLLDGRIEVYYRAEGVAVLRIHEFRDQLNARMRISRLACQTMSLNNRFWDAELDEGETYQ